MAFAWPKRFHASAQRNIRWNSVAAGLATRFDVFIVVLKQLFGVALSVQQRRRGTQADFGFAFVNYTTRNRDALLGSWSVVRFSL